MVPSVFISSTVEDLRHIRDAVRSTVEEVGYRPIMSEHGEIGFMDGDSVEDACYKTISECQIMVVIVGKRYGNQSQKDTNRTITEVEVECGKKICGHILTLVERDVLTFKKVYEANLPATNFVCPGMNEPLKTFDFINRIDRSTSKNAIIPFDNAAEIREIIKKQFATLFGRLLVSKSSPEATTLNEIASELKTLRAAMSYQKTSDSKFLTAMRFLFDESNAQFRAIVQRIFGGEMEKAIPKMIEAENFDRFIEASKVELKLKDLKLEEQTTLWNIPGMVSINSFSYFIHSGKMPAPSQAVYAWCAPATIFMNDVAKSYCDVTYAKLKRSIDNAT